MESYQITLSAADTNYLASGDAIGRPQDIFLDNGDGSDTGHSTPGEDEYRPCYMMSAQGYNEHAFNSWTLTDEGGNVVDDWPEIIDQNYTFTANFIEVKTITGTVKDGNTPLAGADVQISGLGDLRSVTTNDAGEFSVVVPNVDNPEFTVGACKKGYMLFQQDFTEIPTSPLEISLEKPEETVTLYGFTYGPQSEDPSPSVKKGPLMLGDGNDDLDVCPSPLENCTRVFQEAEIYGAHTFVVKEGKED